MNTCLFINAQLRTIDSKILIETFDYDGGI